MLRAHPSPSRRLSTALASAALVSMGVASGCAEHGAPSAGSTATASAPSPPAPSSAAAGIARATASAGATGSAAASASATGVAGAAGRVRLVPDFAEAVRALSERPGDFPSDNLISNETSYLQVAPALRARSAGGVYVGVGPEQNFSYLAHSRPELAFIVDIRRDNMLLHLLYKAAFELAASREDFVALVLGRELAPSGGPASTLDEVLSRVDAAKPTPEGFARVHTKLVAAVRAKGPLDAGDDEKLRAMHETFFKKGLELRFEMKPSSGRTYPTLRELLSAPAPEGSAGGDELRGFLASEASFRFVQAMQRDDRVVPVVGDFVGPKALAGVAERTRALGLEVRTFYVSNVEQYLLEGGTWARWVRAIEALPRASDAVFVRGYLDQGKRHPRQWKGHRTASVTQPMTLLLARGPTRAYPSFLAAASDGL